VKDSTLEFAYASLATDKEAFDKLPFFLQRQSFAAAAD
jgi:hypothetical protein